MSKYIITGLRNGVAIRENKEGFFLGNINIKKFNSKKEVLNFKKTKDFKKLDDLCPCEWHTIEVEDE